MVEYVLLLFNVHCYNIFIYLFVFLFFFWFIHSLILTSYSNFYTLVFDALMCAYCARPNHSVVSVFSNEGYTREEKKTVLLFSLKTHFSLHFVIRFFVYRVFYFPVGLDFICFGDVLLCFLSSLEFYNPRA